MLAILPPATNGTPPKQSIAQTPHLGGEHLHTAFFAQAFLGLDFFWPRGGGRTDFKKR